MHAARLRLSGLLGSGLYEPYELHILLFGLSFEVSKGYISTYRRALFDKVSLPPQQLPTRD